MKDGAPCPKCGGSDILFLPRVTDYQDSALAAFVSDAEWRARGTLRIRGVFLAFVCRSCGYTEFYAHEPDLIPVDEIPGAELRRARPPYR